MKRNDDLDKLDVALRELRIAYEKYFAGIDRVEPLRDKEELKRSIQRLIGGVGSNTARRFRLQTLQSSFVTYDNYWTRIARQIEEGTYKRDIRKAQRRVNSKPAEANQAEQSASAGGNGKRKTGPAFPDALKKLHSAFTSARQQAGDARPISMEALAATVRKQTESIKERYNCTRVEFKVAVKNGKAILKALPK